MTMFRAYSGFPCHGAANPSDDRSDSTNGQSRLGIPILYLGQARDAEYQWINNPLSDVATTQDKMETAVRMNPNSTLILGDEANGSMTSDEYAEIYMHWYSWLSSRSPVTRLSTCGFAATPDPFPFAESFIEKVREVYYVDEFRFNGAFAGDLAGYVAYLDKCDRFAKLHGYTNRYAIGSFFPGDAAVTPNLLRRAMLEIQRRGTVKEAVYWGFDKFTDDVKMPLATYDDIQGVYVPRLSDYGVAFAQVIREIRAS
jgi:hypothetical protein